MTSGKQFKRLGQVLNNRLACCLVLCLLLTSPVASASTDTSISATLELPDFVITPKQLQRILWQDFLIEFPSLYTRADHRIFPTGTVVFYDSSRSPFLFLLAEQEISRSHDASTARVTRLTLRSPSEGDLLDVIISDEGQDLPPTSMYELLLGRIPLDLDEPGLSQKSIAISGTRAEEVKLLAAIRTSDTDDRETTLDVVTKGSTRYQVKDIHNGISREVTWFHEPVNSHEHLHTVRATKVKTDWMLIGSEEFYTDDNKTAAGPYQSDFAKFGFGGAITEYKEQLKNAVANAFCVKNCKGKSSKASSGKK